MKQMSRLVEWIKQLPNWWKTVIAIVGSILTLVSFFRLFIENFYIFTFVIIPLLILTIICFGIYFIFARAKSPVIKGFESPVFSPVIRIAAGTVMFLTLISSGFYYTSEGGKKAVQAALHGTPTLTPTQTLTLTPSPTFTLTPTTPVISDFLYYVIVLDASEKMKESFHGQTKWQVALNTVTEIINGLNPGAKYGLVIVGGSSSSGLGDPCGDPSTPALPFSTRDTVWKYYSELQPQGGGSFSTAFVLAKTQLEGLSRDTIRTLIYITGSSDTCESQDEWAKLEKIVNFPDTTIGLFSQIIILDEDGLKSQTLADQFNNISENINAQAPQTIQDTQGGITIVNVVNNVTNYVKNTNLEIAAGIPAIIPTLTFTPKPGSVPAVPTTPIVIPTTPVVFPIIPTFTPTNTIIPPTSTTAPVSSPFVELLSYNYLQTGAQCQTDITVRVSGNDATGSFHVWNANYGSAGDVYSPTTLPVGTYNNNLVTLGGLAPEFYRHKVWFEYDNGTQQSNILDLICPDLTPSP